MSAATESAMRDAIAAHVADEEDGAVLSDWVVSVSFNTLEALDRGETGYSAFNPDLQALHVSMGITEMAALAYRANYERD